MVVYISTQFITQTNYNFERIVRASTENSPLAKSSIFNLPSLPHHLEYVEVYAAMTLVIFIFALLRIQLVFSCLLRSASKLHSKLFAGVVRAPMSFFQTNSTGLMMKLFSNDVGVADERMPYLTFAAIAVSSKMSAKCDEVGTC